MLIKKTMQMVAINKLFSNQSVESLQALICQPQFPQKVFFLRSKNNFFAEGRWNIIEKDF